MLKKLSTLTAGIATAIAAPVAVLTSSVEAMPVTDVFETPTCQSWEVLWGDGACHSTIDEREELDPPYVVNAPTEVNIYKIDPANNKIWVVMSPQSGITSGITDVYKYLNVFRISTNANGRMTDEMLSEQWFGVPTVGTRLVKVDVSYDDREKSYPAGAVLEFETSVDLKNVISDWYYWAVFDASDHEHFYSVRGRIDAGDCLNSSAFQDGMTCEAVYGEDGVYHYHLFDGEDEVEIPELSNTSGAGDDSGDGLGGESGDGSADGTDTDDLGNNSDADEASGDSTDDSSDSSSGETSDGASSGASDDSSDGVSSEAADDSLDGTSDNNATTVVVKEIITEVPVEKIVVKEVVKEVPVEKTIWREVIKEVPVLKETVIKYVDGFYNSTEAAEALVDELMKLLGVDNREDLIAMMKGATAEELTGALKNDLAQIAEEIKVQLKGDEVEVPELGGAKQVWNYWWIVALVLGFAAGFALMAVLKQARDE